MGMLEFSKNDIPAILKTLVVGKCNNYSVFFVVVFFTYGYSWSVSDEHQTSSTFLPICHGWLVADPESNLNYFYDATSIFYTIFIY